MDIRHGQLLLDVMQGVKSRSPWHAAAEQSRNFGSPTPPRHTGSPREGASGFNQLYLGRGWAGYTGSAEHPRQAGVTAPGREPARCWSRAGMLCLIAPGMETLGAPGTAMAPASPRNELGWCGRGSPTAALAVPSRGEGRPGPLPPGSGSLLHHPSSASGNQNSLMVASRKEEWGAPSMHQVMLLRQEAVLSLPRGEKFWRAGAWHTGRAVATMPRDGLVQENTRNEGPRG